MGIFGLRGTDGLPPLDGDKNGQNGKPQRREVERCRTQECPRPAALNSRYCAQCGLRRLQGVIQEGDAVIEQWPDRETTHELPAVPPVSTAPTVPTVPAIALGEPVLPDLVNLPRKAQELAEIRRYSAPLLDLDRDLDHRCRWCCHIMTEHAATSVLGPVRPTRVNFECERHRARRRAWDELMRMFEFWRREHGAQSEDLAEFYQHGYLGDRLNPDEYI